MPRWYLPVLLLLLALWTSVGLYYRAGGSGIRVSGARVSFGREDDHALYRITDRLALDVQPGGAHGIVTYGRAPLPFSLMCGTHDTSGVALAEERLQGDWLFGIPVEIRHGQAGWERVRIAGLGAVNLTTAEVIRVEVPRHEGWPAELEARGLTRDAGRPATADELVPRLRPLSRQQESCVVLNSAFLIVAALVTLALPLGLILGRRRRTR